jgi:hypothetical protein
MALLVAIREHGARAFTRELVQECSSQKELNAAERAWIEKLGTIIPNGYNAGYGIWRHPHQNARISAGLMGHEVSDESRAKMRAAKIGSKPNAAQLAALIAGRETWATDPRFAIARSEKNGRRRMTDEDIRAIRAARAAGESQQSIADRTGFSQTSISRVVRGVRYAYVPGED